MSFLLENNSENVAARITHKGRQKIAQGNFNISYFQIGDSEFDYGFPEFDGNVNSAQKVLMPLDKDNQVKYPYKVSTSTLTGTTFGTPIQSSYTNTIQNPMNTAGFISGVTIHSLYENNMDIGELDGSSEIYIPNGVFTNPPGVITGLTVGDYITFALTETDNNIITEDSTSFVYRITGITGNVVELDRYLPDLSSLTTYTCTVIKNGYYPLTDGYCDQHDSWTLNTVWSQQPAGLDPVIDEDLSGYTSNVFVSTKEYLGYNTSSGQTSNTGTTITNSFGDVITVLPEEQHSLAILRYPRDIDIYNTHDLGFKYEDYIDSTTDGSDYFEVRIPFIYYDRNTSSTIGANFYMDTTDYYINSSATDTRNNQMKFRYLIDEQDVKVGKVFINQKLIVFDDQEIVAALDYKSNRRYTLPIPRIATVPVDSKCDIKGDISLPLLSGTTNQTVFVTYLLAYTGTTGLNGLHCNQYSKIVGGSVNSDISLTFSEDAFQYMVTGLTNATNGYVADSFYILAQRVDTTTNPNTQPDPTAWKIMDYTSEFTLVGGFIDPNDLRGTRFIISDDDYENLSELYDLEDFLGNFPDQIPYPGSTPEFGDEQPFPGSIELIRATDVEVMRYQINLPSGSFEETQNPSYVSGEDKRITEVSLLDSNKDVLVMAKTSSPIKRTGTQVISVKIDL